MYDVEQLNNKLVITTNDIKKQVLNQLSHSKQLISVQFMTIEEFINHFIFTYDKRAIYYLMKQYKVHFDVANQYLKNLKYIAKEKESEFPNIQKLIELKNELNKNHLLQYDASFQEYLKQKQILILDDSLTKFEQNVMKQVEEITSVQYQQSSYHISSKYVYHFSTIEEEIEYVIADICHNIENGIPISKIYLTNITSEYFFPLKKMSECFHIPMEDAMEHTLYGTRIAKKAIEFLELTRNKEEALDHLKPFVQNNQDSILFHEILDILNQYYFCEVDDIFLECIKQEFKQKKIKQEERKNCIQIQPIDYPYPKDSYVYWLGMNASNTPKVIRDEKFLNDELCEQLHIDTTLEMNYREKQKCIRCMFTIPNLTLTYKDTTPFGSDYPSPLIEQCNLEMKEVNLQNQYHYSDEWNQISLAKKLDQYMLYQKIDSMLDPLWSHYPNIPYQKYNHQYQPICKDEFYSFINKKLLLSYSSIDNFYRCGFRYYVSNILKLTPYEETFFQKIGNLFHYFLSIAFQEQFCFEEEWKRYHENQEYSAKERFFLKKLKEELQFVIQTIEEQNHHSILEKECYEQKIYVNKTGSIQITFMGIIDKIKYQEENGIVYAAIIDYKTGTPETNLNNTIYGIDMQLPVYLYLLDHKPGWNHVETIGFYLQKIINNEFLNPDNKDYIELKKAALKLDGYSIDQMELLEKLDDTYLDSRLIKSMKVGNNGFYAYSKTMSRKKMQQLSLLVEQKIKEATDDILEVKFDIHPKQIGDKLVGCEYCKYHDLCFHDQRDIVYLKEYKNLEFLGEDLDE